MRTKRFLIKTFVKIFIFVIISIIAMTLLESPVITNDIAMGQMENSNELFILMETYNKVRPVVSVIYSFVVLWFGATIGCDLYNFIKIKKNKENEKV